jgi:protein TonB
MYARTLMLAIAAGLAASACSKTEPPPPAKPPTPKTAASAPTAPVAPAKSGDIDEGLKERLARQEAAAKMFESKVLQPPPPRAPEPPPPAAKSPEPAAPKAPPVQAAAPANPPPRMETAKPEPAKAEAPKPAAPQPAAPVASAPAARTDLAAARPPAASPEPQATTRLVAKVDPDFPREAAAAGVEQGLVKARMTLDAAGSVTRVEVLEAKPRRVFDRAVMRALSQWRYNEGAAGRTVDMEVAFRSK